MRLGIRARLLIGFGAVLMLTVVVGVTGLLSLRETTVRAGSMYVDRVVPLRDLAQVRADLGDIDSQIQRVIIDHATGQQAVYIGAAERAAASTNHLAAAYEESSLAPEELAGLVRFKSGWGEYQEAFRGVLRAAVAGDSAEATAIYFSRAAPLYQQLDRTLAGLIDVHDRAARLDSDRIAETYTRALIVIGAVLTTALVLGAAISIRQAIHAEQAHRAIADQADLLLQRAGELEAQASELRATEARNLALLNAIPDSLYRLDRAGLILERHAPDDGRVRLHTRYEGRTLDELLGVEIGARLRHAITQTLATAQPSVVEYERPGAGGTHYREARIVALGQDQALAVIRDIGERKRAERERELLMEQLHQARKMEALGQMASGIAHDFNNALTMIVGGIEILQMRHDAKYDAAEVQQYLSLMSMAAEDAGSVVGRLREVYRPRGEGVPLRPVDLAQIVRESVDLTRPRWSSQAQTTGIRIDVRTELAPTPPIQGNASELREALVNLIFNAVDAMPSGGTITIVTFATDEAVHLVVADSGVGMTEDVRQRCLDPFFTTKGEGGSGLGLGMTYGVLDRHGGTLSIDSTVGVGTSVSLLFPISDTADQLLAKHATEPDVQRVRVLVVDDEPKICEIVRAFLQRDGHVVEVASSGSMALERLATRPFDVLITDRAMPEMSGDQIALAARQIRPTIRTVMMTGFGQLMRAKDEMPPGVDLLLDKPLRLAQLRQAITDVLELARDRPVTTA